MFPSRRAWAPWALVVLALGVLYRGNAHHPFFLDSFHTISENPAIRSLVNLPRFFVDPGTFSTLRSNVDYRPVLQASYAANYALAGYAMPVWHATQLLLHLLGAIGLMVLLRRLLAVLPPEDQEAFAGAPLVVGLLYALHPTASGVVNYQAGRSSLLTATLLVWSLAAYAVPGDDERYPRRPWMAAGLYTLALFTKVEAVAAIAVFWLWDAWQLRLRTGEPRGLFRDLAGALRGPGRRRLTVVFVALAGYLGARALVMAPFSYATASAPLGTTRLQYLMTQAVVGWRYLRQWFAPIDLVADHGAYPVIQHAWEPAFLLAALGWALVAIALVALWRRHPWATFVGISAGALLSPSSSVVPLAEMLNELRPYLPRGLASVLWLFPATAAARRFLPRTVAVLVLTVILGATSWLTWERNLVFVTGVSFWRDVVAKAPAGRACNNLGLALRAAGQLAEGDRYLEEGLRLAPRWYISQMNVGLLRERQGRFAEAAALFDGAVRDDQHSATARVWRSEYRLRRGDYAGARADLEAVLGKSLQRHRILRGQAIAAAGLGDAETCARVVGELAQFDLRYLRMLAIEIVTPMYATGEAGARAGIRALRRLQKPLAGEWWVHENLANLLDRLGEPGGAAARAKSAALRGQAP